MKLIENIKKIVEPKQGTLIQVEITKKGVRAEYNGKISELSKPHKEYIKAFLTSVVNEIDK